MGYLTFEELKRVATEVNFVTGSAEARGIDDFEYRALAEINQRVFLLDSYAEVIESSIHAQHNEMEKGDKGDVEKAWSFVEVFAETVDKMHKCSFETVKFACYFEVCDNLKNKDLGDRIAKAAMDVFSSNFKFIAEMKRKGRALKKQEALRICAEINRSLRNLIRLKPGIDSALLDEKMRILAS